MLSRCLEAIATTLAVILAMIGAVIGGITLLFYYLLILGLMLVVGTGWVISMGNYILDSLDYLG